MEDQIVAGDEPTDLQSAADAIEALLAPEKKAAPEKKPVPAKDPVTGKFIPSDKAKLEAAGEEPPVEEEEEAEATPEKDEEKDETKAEKDEETDDTETPPPQLFRVKVDGQEVDVDAEELKKGYSRNADYTRKTQALAAERAKFEAEDRAAVRAERQQYAERIAALAAVVPMPGEEPNWEDLRNRLSPEEFTEQFTQHRAAVKRIETIRAEQERVLALAEADAQKDLARKVAQAHEQLGEWIPDWKDPVKGKALKDDLIAYAKSSEYHYTDDDLAQVYDPRLLVLLNKARLYDEAQKRKPTIAQKVDRALDTIKPSSVPSKPKGREVEAMQNRLAKSGSVEDAADLIKALKIV